MVVQDGYTIAYGGPGRRKYLLLFVIIRNDVLLFVNYS